MELYLGVLIGAILYLVLGLNQALKLPDFSWKQFYKLNALETIINLMAGFLLVWQKDEVSRWLPFTGLVAVFVGMSGQLILKKVFKIFDTKVDTFIGWNE